MGREWPLAEQDAIAAYFLALWREVIVHGGERLGLSSTVDLFGDLLYCRPDYRPLLGACLESLTPTSVTALKEIAAERIAFNHRQMASATQARFWTEMRAELPGIIEFVTSAETMRRLEAEFFDETSAVDKGELSQAIEAIGRLKRLIDSAT